MYMYMYILITGTPPARGGRLFERFDLKSWEEEIPT